MFDYSIFIGRLCPFHAGHLSIVTEALKKSDYLIMVIGSCNASRNTRVPFTGLERRELALAAIPLELHNRILFTFVEDYPYNDNAWIGAVQSAVQSTIAEHSLSSPAFTERGWRDYQFKIALVGMMKDGTSYYLNSFPQWEKSIAVEPLVHDGKILSSTDIRRKLFSSELDYSHGLTSIQIDRIKLFMERNPSIWANLFSDYHYEQKYEAIYGKGPHVTVDSIVIQAGHIALIQRGREYGKGLWALPGGFLNRRERIEDGAIRELREETGIKVPSKVLRGSIVAREVFDDPYRSNRSHIITNCFKIELENVGELPKIKGLDDAMHAEWIPIGKLESMKAFFFEDHFSILKVMQVI